MRKSIFLVSVVALLAGCAGTSEVEPIEQKVSEVADPQQKDVPAEPESEIAEAEPTSDPQALEDCRAAWAAEREALEVDGETDAALRATAFECPDFATWDSVREEFEAWGDGKTLIVSICVFNPESPVCLDAEATGVDLSI
jgi:hypothetical protein